MKRKFLLLSITSLFVLSGCQFFDSVVNSFKPTQHQSDEETNKKEGEGNNEQQKEDQNGYEEGNKIDFKQVGEFYGGVVINKDYTGYEFSRSQNKIEKPKSGVGEINI